MGFCENTTQTIRSVLVVRDAAFLTDTEEPSFRNFLVTMLTLISKPAFPTETIANDMVCVS